MRFSAAVLLGMLCTGPLVAQPAAKRIKFDGMLFPDAELGAKFRRAHAAAEKMAGAKWDRQPYDYRGDYNGRGIYFAEWCSHRDDDPGGPFNYHGPEELSCVHLGASFFMDKKDPDSARKIIGLTLNTRWKPAEFGWTAYLDYWTYNGKPDPAIMAPSEHFYVRWHYHPKPKQAPSPPSVELWQHGHAAYATALSAGGTLYHISVYKPRPAPKPGPPDDEVRRLLGSPEAMRDQLLANYTELLTLVREEIPRTGGVVSARDERATAIAIENQRNEAVLSSRTMSEPEKKEILERAEREIGDKLATIKEHYKAMHAAALKAFPLVEVLGPKQNAIQFKADAGSLAITADGKPLATYFHRDAKTPRPFFAHLHAPGGIQVSRNHPPIGGKDATDHAEFHPGLWLAFGDISGADNWRLKAHVKHDKFVQKPTSDADKASFAVKNHFLANDGKKLICEETCRITIHAKPAGHLLSWDSQFRSADGDFTFGDQEEMGLGVRLATALTVKAGGQILTSEGHKNEKQVRGKSSPWCDYSGTIDGKRVGITLMQHPKNFRPAWYHARDYGLLVLNPFGRNALIGGERSRVTVKQGETLRLRYGIFLHGDADPAAAFRDYLASEPDA